MDHILSERFTIIHPTWVALHGMAHSFIELCKPLHHDKAVIHARRSNQSILKEINPEYSLEGLMLKLELPYFGHLMRRADPVEKTLMLGKIEDRRRRRRQRMRWLDGIPDSVDMCLGELRKLVMDRMDREAWRAAVHGVAKSRTH